MGDSIAASNITLPGAQIDVEVMRTVSFATDPRFYHAVHGQ